MRQVKWNTHCPKKLMQCKYSSIMNIFQRKKQLISTGIVTSIEQSKKIIAENTGLN